MKKEQAVALKAAAAKAGLDFSRTDREFNHGGETFVVARTIPLSDQTAWVVYRKSPSGKLAGAFFYWINGSGGQWRYWFPTDSHVMGMARVSDMLLKIEQYNYPKNFEQAQ